MQDSTFDVIVLGLGAMGAATLYQLARRGVKVAGIDRYAPPHELGSSHGATRITRQAVGEGAAYVPLAIRSQQLWRELEAERGVRLFEQCGVLIMTATATATSHHGRPDFTQATLELARQYEIPHEAWDGAAIRQRFPQFRVAEDALGYFEPGGGYLYPEACIQAQLDGARGRGAQIHTNTVIERLETDGQGVSLHSAQGRWRAKRVIVAAGMWSAELLGAPFDQLLRVCRQTLHWFEVAKPELFPADSPSFILAQGSGDSDLFYGFPPLAGENAVKVATEQYQDNTTPIGINRSVRPEEPSRLFSSQVGRWVDGLADRAVRSTVCAYTVTPDFGFIVDEHPTLPGVTVVSACSGHGFKHSAALGKALAQRVTTGRSDIDLGSFGLARFG
ncbi:N-methyl-L-tryptophan oxidase [Pseudomonas sp. AS2.8]|uniref:N-methyl-L-tryptophan oxidase n=1 Tax=Pseudomonas sp. AS2.8 TaxID=2587128 RepID=UPI0016157D6E|nr:N-methyl-L-tryptophan oxidase [Pseudomonas sp. AS2.8]MBB2896092.1 monomeric sarcosine oxidase [Pseudomonas sp. AS2.8]